MPVAKIDDSIKTLIATDILPVITGKIENLEGKLKRLKERAVETDKELLALRQNKAELLKQFDLDDKTGDLLDD